MSTEYFIHKSLREAGFSRAEARCAVENVSAHLSHDQMGSLRGPLLDYIMLDDPPEPMDVDQYLSWLAPKVSPEIHQVLAHYANHCRPPVQEAAEGT